MKRFLLCLMITLFISGISWLDVKAQLFGPSKEFQVRMLQAPETQLEGIKRIAVLEFESIKGFEYKRLGQLLADNLAMQLGDPQRGYVDGETFIKGGTTKLYELVERNQLTQVLAEQNISATDRIDQGTAVEIGKVLGLDAIILGSYDFRSGVEVSEQTFGAGYTATKTLSGTATMKIVSVKTAGIITSTSVEQVYAEKFKSDSYISQASLPSDQDMAPKLIDKFAVSLADYIAPRYVATDFTLMNSKNKEYKKKEKKAREYLEDKNLKRAYNILYGVYQEDNYNPRAAYNLALLYEAVGSYEEANEHYNIAYQLVPDEGTFYEGLKRTERSMKMMKRFDELGIAIENFEFGSADKSAMAAKAVIKGNRKDRIKAYNKPKGKVIAELPGGLEFEVLDEKKDYYLLKLIGGKKGYVKKNDIDEVR